MKPSTKIQYGACRLYNKGERAEVITEMLADARRLFPGQVPEWIHMSPTADAPGSIAWKLLSDVPPAK